MRMKMKSAICLSGHVGLNDSRQRLGVRRPSAAFQFEGSKAAEGRRTPKAGAPLLSPFAAIIFWFATTATVFSANTTLLYNAIVHTGNGQTFTNSGVLIEGQKISMVMNGQTSQRLTVHDMIDLKGQHIYPGLIALDTTLGLTEIDAVRATQDSTEVGDYTPDVESWVA